MCLRIWLVEPIRGNQRMWYIWNFRRLLTRSHKTLVTRLDHWDPGSFSDMEWELVIGQTVKSENKDLSKLACLWLLVLPLWDNNSAIIQVIQIFSQQDAAGIDPSCPICWWQLNIAPAFFWSSWISVFISLTASQPSLSYRNINLPRDQRWLKSRLLEPKVTSTAFIHWISDHCNPTSISFL